mgnify:CR=1 FL=1
MLFNYEQIIGDFGSDYQVKKQLEQKKLFKQEKGIYSDKEHVSQLEIIAKKYPDAVFTMQSAFYYQGLTDEIPDKYYLATQKSKQRIRDKRVVQIYENSNGLMLGVEKLVVGGVELLVYDKERLLVELMRKRSRLRPDEYKELIRSFRKISDELDFAKVGDYAQELPKTSQVMNSIKAEVL